MVLLVVCRLLLQRLELLQVLVMSGQPVLVADVATVWHQDVAAYMAALAALGSISGLKQHAQPSRQNSQQQQQQHSHRKQHQPAGFDIVAPPAAVPVREGVEGVLRLRGTAAGDASLVQAVAAGMKDDASGNEGPLQIEAADTPFDCGDCGVS